MYKVSRNFKKSISAFLSFVMFCLLLGNISIYGVELSEDGYEKTNILKPSSQASLVSDDASHTAEDGTYNGYIQTLENLTSDYLRITYTVSGELPPDAKVFSFKPFDSAWGGWEDNFATIGDSVLENGVYTFTIDTQKIKQSLTTGKPIKGINLEFCPDIGASVTLTGYYSLKIPSDEPTEEKAQLPEARIIKTITEKDLAEAGCNWFGSNKVKVYVKVTNATKFSWINSAASLGTNRAGKASSKYIHGSECTVKTGGNYIQNGIIGKAGTGNYVFPDTNLNTSSQSGEPLSADEQKKITIDIKTGTIDTDCELLGLVFSNKAVYPKGFKVPVCEAVTLDTTDAGEYEKLKMTLDYCDKMTASKYTSESWKAFQTALSSAKEVYKNASLAASDYTAARSALEETKSKLLFIASENSGNPLPFRTLSPKEIVSEMGAGWNLGNTMDGHSGFTPGETTWQPYITTKAMIKSVHDLGINTIRIPVTWGTMIDEENGYKINEKWISRVQDIVDYCVSLDMYAIINIHHDGAEQDGWLRVAADDIDSVYEEFECVWRNIAEKFKDYDEHLIFESMNEVTSGSNDKANVLFDNPIIMNMNQIFVNVVRSTGSNNMKRWLSLPGHYALPSAVTNKDYGFKLPIDSVPDRLFVAAHIYAGPSGFYMGSNMTSTVCNFADCTDMINKINVLGTTWSKKGVPVIIGEFGCINKNNPTERAHYIEIFNRSCKNAGMLVPCYWDHGWFDRAQTPADYSFSIIDRKNLKPIEKEVTDGLMRGIELTGDAKDITKNPAVVPITDITVDSDNINITIGESVTVNAVSSPASSNDVLLWSSDDESVATVYRGKIRGRGIGSTTVKAFSQSGSFEKTILVNVLPNENSSIETINVPKDSFTLAVGQSEYLTPEFVKQSDDDFVTYKSSDNNIATVSTTGKILGISKGFAVITITAPNGVTKAVSVSVSDTIQKNYINLAANVLYNDSSRKYYGNEVGESVKVTGDNQYTLSFDVEKDLSARGKSAGVTALKNLTAIYIKDLDVTNGNDTVSPLTSCKIKYDKITVDGTEMTIINTEPKEAVNSSGIFDTGDPINGYDGSAISEVSVSQNICNFKTVTNPKKIEITFTLSDIKFKEAEEDGTVRAETITSEEKNININNIGETKDIYVTVSPKNVTSKVSFVSSDESIVSLLSKTSEVNENTGTAVAKIKGLKKGTAAVTAYIDNVTPVSINVYVGEETSGVLGDADGNNKIEVNDAVIILNYVLKHDDKDASLYDMDKNNIIDARDAALVLKKALEN